MLSVIFQNDNYLCLPFFVSCQAQDEEEDGMGAEIVETAHFLHSFQRNKGYNEVGVFNFINQTVDRLRLPNCKVFLTSLCTLKNQNLRRVLLSFKDSHCQIFYLSFFSSFLNYKKPIFVGAFRIFLRYPSPTHVTSISIPIHGLINDKRHNSSQALHDTPRVG
jgi:hypothetical protein